MSPRDLPGQAATRPTVLTVKSLILYSFVSLAGWEPPEGRGRVSLGITETQCLARRLPSDSSSATGTCAHTCCTATGSTYTPYPETHLEPRALWKHPCPLPATGHCLGGHSSVQSGHSLPGQQWVGLSPNEMSTPPAGPREAAAGLQPSVCGSRSPLSGLRFQRKVTSLPRPVTAASVRAVRWGPADGEGSSACPQPCCCSCGAAPPTPGPSG